MGVVVGVERVVMWHYDVGMVGSCQVNDGTTCTNMTTWSVHCHKVYKDPPNADLSHFLSI